MQIRECLQQASAQLASSSDSARLDAELLLSKILDKPRSYLFAWPEQPLSFEQQGQFQKLLAQRLQGMPIAYLLGSREFWGMELTVSPATLIPRPDTELLVELALDHLPQDQIQHVLDLGTGSGAIALAIAKERPLTRIIAVDQSLEALNIAQYNQQKLGLQTISFLKSNWFESIPQLQFDMIVSNPPYIADTDPHLLQGDVRFEPRSALSAGKDGLSDLKYIIVHAVNYLKPQAWLLLEHGYKQGLAVTELLKKTGYSEVACYQDYAGNDRVSLGRYL